MNYHPEAIITYVILLGIFFIFLLPLVFGVYKDLVGFLRNKFKTLFNGKDSKGNEPILRDEEKGEGEP